MVRIFNIAVVGLVLLLTGCATPSEQQFKLAQQSVQQGDYDAAFNQAAQSLQANIGNYKMIGLFPGITRQAYAQQLSQIDHYKQARKWDQAAHGYDRISAMNRTLKQLQQALALFGNRVNTSKANRAAINSMLAIEPRDVDVQRNDAYKVAAEAHYANGQRYAKGGAFRQAQSEFAGVLSFINPYRDAGAQAAKNGHLADLADAKMHYRRAVQAVQQQHYRVAANAFARADGFIPGYRDAYALAAKYKAIADQADALIRYRRGKQLAAEHQYRAAATAFTKALSFVPGYRDASLLATRYSRLADRADAGRYYEQGIQLMQADRFAEAARSFARADQFVPGFRDARDMAERAESFVPPDSYQLRHIVQQSVHKGIPLSWLHDVHRGYTEDVQIRSVSVLRQGRFNHRREFWPYRLRLSGTCKLEIARGNEQVVGFDTIVDYRLFRNDFGDWQADFREARRGR